MENKPHSKSFVQLSYSQYIESVYESYQKDPETVDPSWRRFFEGMEFANFDPKLSKKIQLLDSKEVGEWIEAFRRYGYLEADFNPLEPKSEFKEPLLQPENYGLKDSAIKVPTHGLMEQNEQSVGALLEYLKSLYCSKVGFEFSYIQNQELKNFIQSKIEGGYFKTLTPGEKKQILHFLNRSELLESFLHTKYVGQKRFSIEGLETFIPIVRAIVDHGSEHGLDEIVICMAHRGRLNILANIFEKPYGLLFHEFGENYEPSEEEGTGDVKYHKGYSADIESRLGKRLHISIPPNSSHLESVNAVALGQVKAKQIHKKDEHQERILAIQVHGDASIAGQGVIYEDLQMSKLDGYSSGGSIHIIMDNQIGFTTAPIEGRSTPYPSDIAKTFDAPVFHVNAEDPEGCVLASYLAIEIRQKFKCEVFIHLVGYRKYGHNEGDEPSYTQPLQYQVIRKKKAIRSLYLDRLIKEGILTQEEGQAQEKEFKNKLQLSLDESVAFKENPPKAEALFGNRWGFWKEAKLKDKKELFKEVRTCVEPNFLKQIAQKMTEYPGDFKPHKKIVQLLGMRRAAVLEPQQKPIMDWGLVENLAYGTLLSEGYPIRLAGQDCRRGTFSHRHAVIVDQESQESFIPLNHLSEEQEYLTVYNSPLSEYGCLGFEYGYSISTSKGLIIWEAQFGDFANGAQIIIDAYIAGAEEKWNRLSDLILYLPHGYEGQGPEHSSARMERYLQLAGNDNMVLVNPSKPSQLFHLLRRHAMKGYRKPLIVFSPKKMLRHPLCTSSIEELTDGAFETLIDDPQASSSASELVFCSGKVYYEAFELKEKHKRKNMALIRVEQLYPFDQEKLKAILAKYQKIEKVYWLQEEPKNMGAWFYIRPYLDEALPKEIDLSYIGRVRTASTAEGTHKRHQASLKFFMSNLFPEEA